MAGRLAASGSSTVQYIGRTGGAGTGVRSGRVGSDVHSITFSSTVFVRTLLSHSCRAARPRLHSRPPGADLADVTVKSYHERPHLQRAGDESAGAMRIWAAAAPYLHAAQRLGHHLMRASRGRLRLVDRPHHVDQRAPPDGGTDDDESEEEADEFAGCQRAADRECTSIQERVGAPRERV